MNIYEMVTDRIIAKLEKAEESGKRFRWVKPFDITNSVRYACNYETLIPYTGINRLLAEPDEYLTFNQIKKMNERSKDDFLHIRKGAKGTPILYVNWKEILDDEGNIKTDKDGNPVKRPFFKYYTVFSRQDALFKDGQNLPSKVPTKHFSYEEIEGITQRELLRFTSMITHYCNQYGIELQFINDGTEAYFSPTDRVIRIGNLNGFSSIFEHISTLAHEAIHSTMIINNRVSENEYNYKEKYSREELVAEIGAAMLISQFRIADDSQTKDNDIAYIQGWRTFIKDSDTKGIIIGAAQHAQKACDLVLDTKLRLQILEEIKENPSAFEIAPEFMKLDIDFVREALDNNPLVWDFVTYEIKEELSDGIGDTVGVSAINSFDILDEER